MVGSRHTPLRLALRRPWPGTRRGLCLWFFSVAFIFLGGINYIATPVPPRTEKALTFAFDIAPPPFWGSLMVLAAVVSIFCSYCHFGRDRYGFVILATFCAGWGLAYVTGGLFYHAGPRAFSGCVIWMLFSAILVLIAGFPNVTLSQPTRLRREDI